MDTYVGSFTTGTSTGNKSITGVGFTPKVVIFFTTAETYNAAATYTIGYGAMTTTAQGFNGLRTVDGTSGASCAFSTAKAWNDAVMSGGAGCAFTYVSMDGSGFTINLSVATTSFTMNFIALGGSDMEANIGSLTVPSSFPTTFGPTGLAFQPNVVMAGVCREGATTTDTNYSDGMISFGMASGTSNEYSLACSDANGASGYNDTRISSNIGKQANTAFSNFVAGSFEFTSFNADGFTLTKTAGAAATSGGWYLCMNLPQVAVGVTTLQTSLVTWDITSGVAFAPEGLLLLSACSAGTLDSTVTSNKITMGASDTTNHRGSSIISIDGGHDVGAIQYTDGLLKGYNRDSADTFSVDSVAIYAATQPGTGFRLDQNDAAPTAGYVIYLAFATAAAPGSPSAVLRLLL